MSTTKIQDNRSHETRIALWGPSGAGKDWLFRAFVKELSYYNLNDQEFHYDISEIISGGSAPIPLSAEPPVNIPPTTYEDDVHYLFSRKAILQDPAHLLSAARHDLIIHNDKGQDLVDSLDDPENFERTFSKLINTKNIFLVLQNPVNEIQNSYQPHQPQKPETNEEIESPFIKVMNNFPSEAPGEETNSVDYRQRPFSQNDYLMFIKRLLYALQKKSGLNLAVCLTKADQSPLKGDPWFILERMYGSALRRELEMGKQRHNIQVFVTSSAGYFRQDGRTMPNFQNGALRDPQKWRPVNTAAPFFWIFEQIERANLAPKQLLGPDFPKMYLPYPRPRSF